jgi:hypothetical protein
MKSLKYDMAPFTYVSDGVYILGDPRGFLDSEQITTYLYLLYNFLRPTWLPFGQADSRVLSTPCPNVIQAQQEAVVYSISSNTLNVSREQTKETRNKRYEKHKRKKRNKKISNPNTPNVTSSRTIHPSLGNGLCATIPALRMRTNRALLRC